MMMSMFSSVSGLRAHQTRMDVIGNNIANVNTVGFKGSRSTFQEIFSQTFRGAGSPDPATGRGGTNPMQIGLGMSIDAIDTQMGRGSVQRTDSPTDISIEGEGFFVVRSGTAGPYTFTRAGNFSVDRLGNLVTAGGNNVLGWMKYEAGDEGFVFDTQEDVKPLNLYEDEYNLSKRIIAARRTTEAVMAGNLDATEPPFRASVTADAGLYAAIAPANDAFLANGAAGADGVPDNVSGNIPPQFIIPVNVYDELGNAYSVNIRMWKSTVNTGTSTLSTASPITSWYYTVDGGANATTGATLPASGFIAFDATGRLVTGDPTNLNTRPTITITPNASTGARAFDVDMDLAQLSMFADDSSVRPLRVDGYPPGTLVTFSVGSDGILTGVYDNGRQQPLGRIAMAVFANPSGLAKVGNNLFMATANSGEFSTASVPGSDGAGTLVPGTLEMSNVDLAKQFTEMIITQRGFQANSRVVTTSDEILQELTNLKR